MAVGIPNIGYLYEKVDPFSKKASNNDQLSSKSRQINLHSFGAVNRFGIILFKGELCI